MEEKLGFLTPKNVLLFKTRSFYQYITSNQTSFETDTPILLFMNRLSQQILCRISLKNNSRWAFQWPVRTNFRSSREIKTKRAQNVPLIRKDIGEVLCLARGNTAAMTFCLKPQIRALGWGSRRRLLPSSQ